MRRTTLYTLQVTILDGLMTNSFSAANPVISRTIEIRSDQTLNQLHRAIFEAFERWDDCHLHEFHLGREPRDRHARRYVLPFVFEDPQDLDGGARRRSVTQTRIGTLGLEAGSVFWYWYDFGDDWYHEIRVLAIGEAEPKVKYPRVIASVGDSPPQYVDWGEEPDEPAPSDWLSEVLQCGDAELAVESGVIPIAEGAFVPWIRRRIAEHTAALAAEREGQTTYSVTTLKHLPDGTSDLTSELVPGQYLDPWLNGLIRDGDATVLSIEVAGGKRSDL